MANGSGVSVTAEKKKGKATGRWRVRWREDVLEDGMAKRRQRERTVATKAAAIAVAADIQRKLDEGLIWKPDAVEVETPASLSDIGSAWLQAKKVRGRSHSTMLAYADRLQRSADCIRHLEGIAPDEVIPVTLLSRELLMRVASEIQTPTNGRTLTITKRLSNGETQTRTRPARKLSASTVYSTTQALLECWRWAEGGNFTGLPLSPRDSDAMPVDAPVYAPTDPPELAHVDALILELASVRQITTGLAAAVVMRWTGLRITQALGLTWDDLNEELGTLTVPAALGKTRAEKAADRTLPMPPAFFADLERVCDRSGVTLVPRRGDYQGDVKTGSTPAHTLKAAWKRLTVAGKVPQEVWQPSNRKVARPDHAFRAALQQHLEQHGVRAAVIDAITGHVAGVRSRHYTRPTHDEIREGLATLGPIPWPDEPSNVVQLHG
jgi:integrase